VRTVVITVDPKGASQVETKGFSGASCREASRFVEEALGRRTAEHLTPEFYAGQEARSDLRQST
jgi:hypothetical protein